MRTRRVRMKLTQHDLDFILKQIKIAEANSLAHSGDNAKQLTDVWVDPHGNTTDESGSLYDENSQGVELALGSSLLHFGLRAVDGSNNNIVEGRGQWGAW